MSIRTTLHLSSEASLEEGTPAEVADKERRAHDAKLRPKRLEAARRNSRWHELEEVDLVPRGRGWLVTATMDEIFSPVRGVVFEPGSATVIVDMVELWFYVDARTGELHFLERVNTPATWTDHLEKQAAPKPPPAWMEP